MENSDVIQTPTHDTNGNFAKGNKFGKGRIPVAQGGKPNAITLAREKIELQLEEVLQSMIDSALAGDTAAGKLVISLVMPQLKQTESLVHDISKLPRMIVESKVILDVETIEEPEPSK